MYKINFINKFTKIAIDVFFLLGIIVTLSVPFITKPILDYLGFEEMAEYLAFPTIIVLLISGACAVYIIFHLRKIFQAIGNGNPFVIENARYLRNMAVGSFVICVVFILKIFYWFTFATVIIALVFLMAGLFCLTLKDLFTQAVKFKEDNDLTI